MYKNYISLGYYCGPAASMEFHGFRRTSGPFDWYVSDYKGVIRSIDEKFEHFLEFENLQHVEGAPHFFNDVKYGFLFNHEIGIGKEPDRRYFSIKEKYQRRYQRFLQMLGEGCFLLRAVKDQEEIEYINENNQYINRLFCEYSQQNMVIYLISNNLIEENDIKFPYYKVDKCILNLYESTHLLEQNSALLQFMSDNILASDRINNMQFYNQKHFQVMENRYNMAIKLLNTYESGKKITGLQHEHIIIYGCGNIGQALYKLLRSCAYKIIAFIDEFSWDEQCEGIPILKLEDEGRLSAMIDKSDIVVTPIADFEDIKKHIREIYCTQEFRVFSIENILQQGDENNVCT